MSAGEHERGVQHAERSHPALVSGEAQKLFAVRLQNLRAALVVQGGLAVLLAQLCLCGQVFLYAQPHACFRGAIEKAPKMLIKYLAAGGM